MNKRDIEAGRDAAYAAWLRTAHPQDRECRSAIFTAAFELGAAWARAQPTSHLTDHALTPLPHGTHGTQED